jgi:long-chain acyl-CoA synthetase
LSDRLLITGATGFVGRLLVSRLRAAHPDREIVALVRDLGRASFLASDGVRLVTGDIGRPNMGVPVNEYQALAASVTQIVHCAGDVNFGATLPVSRAANVFGTQQVVNFARACPRLNRVAHLSSISIHGTRVGPLAEEPSPAGHRFVNSYQQSKHEAEWLVFRAMREIPAEIFRISMIGADTPSGEVSQFNYVHHLIRYLPNSPLPVMPGDPATCVDLVPADWAVSALAFLFDRRFSAGAVRNICAGLRCSLPFGDALRIAGLVMERQFNTPVRFPRLVPAAEFDSMLAETGDWRIKEAAAILGPHVNLLAVRQSFSNERTLDELDGSGLVLPALASWFPRMIEYCLRSNWGGGGSWSMIEAADSCAAPGSR